MTDRPRRVVDDASRHRFLITQDGLEAELVYRVEGGRLDVVHTYVPPALRGRGVAGRLVRAAAERAQRTGETIVPTCPFARRWLQRHPDAAAGVTIDWGTDR